MMAEYNMCMVLSLSLCDMDDLMIMESDDNGQSYKETKSDDYNQTPDTFGQ
jgi:hypothetical protein